MSDGGITIKTKHDWSRADARTDKQNNAAALADPDAKPLTDAYLDRMKQTPRMKIIRRALGLKQEEFAAFEPQGGRAAKTRGHAGLGGYR
jgi:hypothetical protein